MGLKRAPTFLTWKVFSLPGTGEAGYWENWEMI